MDPLASDYKRAVRNPAHRFRTLRIKPVPNPMAPAEPFFSCGNFAAVFKVADDTTGRHYALKCFTQQRDGMQTRYHAISNYLNRINSAIFCSYEFLPDEIYITSSTTAPDGDYPVLKTEWIEGQTLGQVLTETCKQGDGQRILNLLPKWKNLCTVLKTHSVAHGDLKHDNILVTLREDLRLIDYDGMFVPTLKGKAAIELGSECYQHPKRDRTVFDEKLDVFSIDVITVSLLALAENTGLYVQYNNGENILFRKSDFLDFEGSPLVKDLHRLNHPEIKTRLKHLTRNLQIEDLAALREMSLWEEVTVDAPAAVIFLVDDSREMKLNRRGEAPADTTKHILNELIAEVQTVCTQNGKVCDYFHVGLILYNSYKDTAFRLQPLSSMVEFYRSPGRNTNREGGLQAVAAAVQQWRQQFLKSIPPVVIEITTSVQPATVPWSLTDSPPQDQVIYFAIRAIDQGPGNVFPTNGIGISRLPVCVTKFLQRNYRLNVPDGSAGLLENPGFVLTLKFLHSVLKGFYYWGKQ